MDALRQKLRDAELDRLRTITEAEEKLHAVEARPLTPLPPHSGGVQDSL